MSDTDIIMNAKIEFEETSVSTNKDGKGVTNSPSRMQLQNETKIMFYKSLDLQNNYNLSFS